MIGGTCPPESQNKNKNKNKNENDDDDTNGTSVQTSIRNVHTEREQPCGADDDTIDMLSELVSNSHVRDMTVVDAADVDNMPLLASTEFTARTEDAPVSDPHLVMQWLGSHTMRNLVIDHTRARVDATQMLGIMMPVGNAQHWKVFPLGQYGNVRFLKLGGDYYLQFHYDKPLAAFMAVSKLQRNSNLLTNDLDYSMVYNVSQRYAIRSPALSRRELSLSPQFAAVLYVLALCYTYPECAIGAAMDSEEMAFTFATLVSYSEPALLFYKLHVNTAVNAILATCTNLSFENVTIPFWTPWGGPDKREKAQVRNRYNKCEREAKARMKPMLHYKHDVRYAFPLLFFFLSLAVTPAIAAPAVSDSYVLWIDYVVLTLCGTFLFYTVWLLAQAHVSHPYATSAASKEILVTYNAAAPENASEYLLLDVNDDVTDLTIGEAVKGYCYLLVEGLRSTEPFIEAFYHPRPLSVTDHLASWSTVAYCQDSLGIVHPIVHFTSYGSIGDDQWSWFVTHKAILAGSLTKETSNSLGLSCTTWHKHQHQGQATANQTFVRPEPGRLIGDLNATFKDWILRIGFCFVLCCLGTWDAAVSWYITMLLWSHIMRMFSLSGMNTPLPGYCADIAMHGVSFGLFPSYNSVIAVLQNNKQYINPYVHVFVGPIIHFREVNKPGNLLRFVEAGPVWWGFLPVGLDLEWLFILVNLQSYINVAFQYQQWLLLLFTASAGGAMLFKTLYSRPVFKFTRILLEELQVRVRTWPLLIVASALLLNSYGLISNVFGVTLVLLMIPYVFGDKCNPDLKLYLLSFGSKGDKVPLTFYTNLLNKIGYDATQHDMLNDEEGKIALNSVEQGKFYEVIPKLTGMPALIHKYSRKGVSHVFAPQEALGASKGVTTYQMAPPPCQLKSWRMGENQDNLFFAIINFAFRASHLLSEPDIRIGSFEHCAPRSPDGDALLAPALNLGTRSTIIALGSSSLAEPDDLPMESTWSTNADSKYMHEPDLDHQRMFRKYKNAITHGGAGTMATAAAAGCNVKSLSTMIDRDYVDQPTFVFSQSLMPFWTGFASTLTFDAQMLLVKRVLNYRFVEGVQLAIIVLFKSFIQICFVSAVLAWWVSGVLPNLTATAGDLPSAVANLLYSGIGQSGGIVSTILITATVKVYMASKGTEQQLKCAARSTSWVITTMFQMSRNVFWCQIIFSQPPITSLFVYCTWEWIQQQLWLPGMNGILSTLASMAICGDPFRERIIVRFTKLQEYHGLLPLYHAEYVHPDTKEGVGITVSKVEGVMYCQYEERLAPLDSCMYMHTFIHKSRWDHIKAKIKKQDGALYSPMSNCQTAVFNARYTEGFGIDWVVLGAIASLSVLLVACLGLVLVAVLSFMGFCGLLVPRIFGSTMILTALGDGVAFDDIGSLLVFLFSPSVSMKHHKCPDQINQIVKTTRTGIGDTVAGIFEGPLRVHSAMQYPSTPPLWGCFRPSSYRSMRIRIGRTIGDFDQPSLGVSRPEYVIGRGGSHRFIHSMNEQGINMPPTSKQLQMLSTFRVRLRALKGNVGITAITGERKLQPEVMSWLRSNMDHVIVLTNDNRQIDHCDVIRFDATGRELATLRLAGEQQDDTTWWSLNAELNGVCAAGPKIVYDYVTNNGCDGIVSAIPYGLHPTAAGICAYNMTVLGDHSPDFEIYGADEWALSKIPGVIIVRKTRTMFSAVMKEQDFACKRTIIVTNDRDLPITTFKIKQWNASSLLNGLRRETAVELTNNGCLVNGELLNIAPLVSEMYPQGTPVETVITDIASNPGAFASRCTGALRALMQGAIHSDAHIPEELVSALYKAISAFDRTKRPPKSAWAFVQNELKKERVEELDLNIHPNPVFVMADFDTTLKHYVNHLNMMNPAYQLSPTVFRRSVNTSGMNDVWLKDRLPDDYAKGVDGSVIACKATMISSLSRYIKGGIVDGLTDQRVEDIAAAIINAQPHFYQQAQIANPYKLGKRFLKDKAYSAGVPFIFAQSGIKNRSDLRRHGYLKPLVDLGMLPYKTGEWYPAISHAFPKSQIVKKTRLSENLGKLRSVVATAGFINIQQGVLNYDQNNRHNYVGTNEKVGMPTDGTHMNMVFSELEKCPEVYSADVRDMDASLTPGVFKVLAKLRSQGFLEHPAYVAIEKHIQCQMKQTQHAYILNLIDKDLTRSQIEHEVGPVTDLVFDQMINDSLLPGVLNHPNVPGGIIAKTCGGSTGDSNVTFNNTKALPILIMYAICETHNLSYNQFFEEIVLQNYGDDNMFGPIRMKIDVNKAMDKLRTDFGIIMKIESKGTSLFDQEFLGKRPCDPTPYLHEFELAGVPVPRYAIITNNTALRLRLAKEKNDASRHKGMRHETYRLEKIMGYINLCSHDKEFYDLLSEYFDTVLTRIPSDVRAAPWFKKKFRKISYAEVISKWYKPAKRGMKDQIHGVNFTISKWVQTERMFLRVISGLGWLSDQFPSHLFSLEESKVLSRQSRTSGVTEAHAWHCYVADNGAVPTLSQLKGYVERSPFAAFADADYWLTNHGAALPSNGPLFDRNYNYSVFRLLLYSSIYAKVNGIAGLINKLPMGNVLTEVFNLAMFKSRNAFGALGFAYFVGHARSSSIISGLVPKDPYVYHKQTAQTLESWMPHCSSIGLLPWAKCAKLSAHISEQVARYLNTTFVAPRVVAMTGNSLNGSPWKDAVNEALQLVILGEVPIIVAHTGTGKTRYTPDLVLQNQLLPTTQVIVVMPRRIASEQWSITSGALLKRIGVNRTAVLMTMTYGYLAHCHIHGNKCWQDDTIFIFDEAHEESLEWAYLRANFVKDHYSICLSATPMAMPCVQYPKVIANVTPLYTIDDVELTSDVYDAISQYKGVSTRMVIIEPSLRRCREIANSMAADGLLVKIVHRDDRVIPDEGHVVCTSVVESSITIPGCDLVIDTGERIVNNGGSITRVPNTSAGAIQRRGRTGRTNNGTYVQLHPPVDHEYPPVPDINMVLAGHEMIANTKTVSLKLEKTKANNAFRICDDLYAVLSNKIDDVNTQKSVSIIHKLLLTLHKWSWVRDSYVRLGTSSAEELDHLLKTCNVEDVEELLPFEEARNAYHKANPIYYEGSKPCGSIPIIKGWCIKFMEAPHEMQARVENHS